MNRVEHRYENRNENRDENRDENCTKNCARFRSAIAGVIVAKFFARNSFRFSFRYVSVSKTFFREPKIAKNKFSNSKFAPESALGEKGDDTWVRALPGAVVGAKSVQPNAAATVSASKSCDAAATTGENNGPHQRPYHTHPIEATRPERPTYVWRCWFCTKMQKKIAPLRGAYLYCIIIQKGALRTK